MALKEYEKRAKDNYLAKIKKVQVEFNTEKDQELIEWLETRESKQGYIKELIRADMKEHR